MAMAKMIPEIDIGAHPHGEALFYKWLRDSLPNDYRVFHGVHLLTSQEGTMRRGETDFLVLHRTKGFLIIEVKGGQVRRVPSRSKWISTSHDGQEHEIKDPFMQAESNMNTLAARIGKTDIFGQSGRKLPIICGYAVAFPDGVAPAKDLPLHVDRNIVFDHNDRDRMMQRIERAFEVWGMKRPGSRPMTEQESKELLDRVLMAHYEVTVPLNVRFDKEEEQFTALTDQQCMLLHAIPDAGRALFRGFAGTGKTQLLMERARRYASEGASVLVLCYNQPLAQHLAGWASMVSTGGGGSITVRYFHALCEEYAAKAGLEYAAPEEGSVEEPVMFYETVAPRLLERSLETVADRFDCVLVDEGQDFKSEWFDVAMKLLDPDGRDIFNIYYDEQQNIYGKELRFPFAAEPHTLTFNLRSTSSICALTRKLGGVDIASMPGWVKGIGVKYYKYAKPEEQVQIVEKIVRDLIARQIRPDEIMVISSHKRQRSCMAGVKRLGGYPLVDHTPEYSEDTITFSSLHRAKGLESKVVIFCDVDGGVPYCSKANQYVAVSRARSMLFVVHQKGWRVDQVTVRRGGEMAESSHQ